MNLIQIYECFCDETRLRIISLLGGGPLCVCHFQELLEQPQVRISKHLSYLRAKGMVECVRHQNWMVYSLPSRPGRELDANLRCLQDCASTNPLFKEDMRRRRRMQTRLAWLEEVTGCCEDGSRKKSRRRA